jgi:hypothetical protein
MRVIHRRTTAILLALLPAFAMAQDKPPAPEPPPVHYKLTYRLLDLSGDNKITSAHSYTTVVVVDDIHAATAKIRNGDNIPVPVGPGSSQYNYREVGTNIDTSQAKTYERRLSADVFADLTNVVKLPENPSAPVIRHVLWNSNVVVTMDKPTIIFTSDNTSDAGKTELELTATLIKEP